jgi:hypothetical protein
MTPTKSSLAKSYPHLVPKSPARGTGARVVSPTRTPLRRSVAPEGLTEVVEVNGAVGVGRKFMDIANEREEERAEPGRVGGEGDGGMGNEGGGVVVGGKRLGLVLEGKGVVGGEGHLSSEEEIERRRGVLMRRLRVLRAECEKLEQQLDVARQSKQSLFDTQESTNVDTTMYPYSHGRKLTNQTIPAAMERYVIFNIKSWTRDSNKGSPHSSTKEPQEPTSVITVHSPLNILRYKLKSYPH